MKELTLQKIRTPQLLQILGRIQVFKLIEKVEPEINSSAISAVTPGWDMALAVLGGKLPADYLQYMQVPDIHSKIHFCLKLTL